MVNTEKFICLILKKSCLNEAVKTRFFAVDGFKIGVQICFDLWFPELSRTQRKMGANLFCVLANFGGQTSWRISQIRAIENLTPLALCNRVGEESIDGMDADFLGKSTLVNADGQLLCVAPEKRMHVCVCDIPASISKGNSNVICSNFDAEIALHNELFLRQ